ncbi:pentapeptide repeat-containing protein [Picosynechococcus sp. NKBG042902]|uniref:pentapeptide repeat-containing protein n=1 Tax=Picosynechococcus sp. NKBG042902 TaxID=490193 RepID=UPI0006942805|nr:pentapeptide repeat-containing protein [Picosynechococcus sp. NKBG042902]
MNLFFKIVKNRLFIICSTTFIIFLLALHSDEDWRKNPSTFDVSAPFDWRLVEIFLGQLEAIAITSAAILYICETSDRKRQSIYEAWQVIDNSYASNMEMSYARIEALEFLVKEKVSLSGISLFDKSNNLAFNLTNINLEGADLTGSNLTNVNLTGANLKNAILYKACLSSANLEGADLTHSDLREAKLKGANLKKAILIGASLQKAELQSQLDIPGSSEPERVKMLQSIISISHGVPLNQLSRSQRIIGFKNLISSGAYLKTTKLEEADLTYSNLEEANLVGVDFKNANLTNADLNHVRFTSSYGIPDPLYLANTPINVVDAVSISPNYEGAIFQNTQLSQDLSQTEQTKCSVYKPRN